MNGQAYTSYTARMGAFALLAALCSGCMLKAGSSVPLQRYYDLGSDPVAAANCIYDVRIQQIDAPPHLQSNRIWYRYADKPFELAAYSISRWVAPPAQMLTQRLQSAFQHDLHRASLSTPLMQATLELRLMRMELSVPEESADTTTGRSIVELSARVITDGEHSGMQLFELQKPARVSPAGAAEAMAQSLNELPTALCNWLIAHERAPQAAKLSGDR